MKKTTTPILIENVILSTSAMSKSECLHEITKFVIVANSGASELYENIYSKLILINSHNLLRKK